jgi:hypothetical protein
LNGRETFVFLPSIEKSTDAGAGASMDVRTPTLPGFQPVPPNRRKHGGRCRHTLHAAAERNADHAYEWAQKRVPPKARVADDRDDHVA